MYHTSYKECSSRASKALRQQLRTGDGNSKFGSLVAGHPVGVNRTKAWLLTLEIWILSSCQHMKVCVVEMTGYIGLLNCSEEDRKQVRGGAKV